MKKPKKIAKLRFGQRKLTDEQREYVARDWADAVSEAVAHPELVEERQREAERVSRELHATYRGTGA